MDREKLEAHLQSMNLRALFEILLGRTEQYDADTLAKVRHELERRGIALDSVVDKFEIRLNDDLLEVENLDNLDRVGQLIDGEMSVWDTLSINNYFHEQLTIKKGYDIWIIQHVDIDDGVVAFGLDEPERIIALIRNFLSLDDWEPAEEDRYTLEDWETILNTTSLYYLEGLMEVLERAEIPYFIERNQAVSADPLFVTPTPQERQVLFIPGDYLDDYNELMSAWEQQKTELLAQLETLHAAADLEGQLAVYHQLDNLPLVDSSIFYDKGRVLFELDRFDEAAEAVIFSVNLDIELGQLSVAYDSMELLEEILAETPKNLEILHCLAHLEAQRDNLDDARGYYQQILAIDENNEVAHLNLGYLYYENDEMESLARKHFNKYLEVAKSEEERKVVEDLLRQMG